MGEKATTQTGVLSPHKMFATTIAIVIEIIKMRMKSVSNTSFHVRTLALEIYALYVHGKVNYSFSY